MMAIRLDEWLRVLEADYFTGYIPADGFAVKFAIAEPSDMAELSAGLQKLADAHGLRWTPIDAAVTRLHMMHDVFFAIARQVDWRGVAQKFVETLLAERAYAWPETGKPAAFHAVAATNDIAEHILRKDVKQWLTAEIWDDSLLAQDFRAAMMRLCLKRFEPESAENDPILQWLTGDLAKISSVKDDDIFTKITRSNARAMLASLCRWLARTGGRGLLVYVDISQLALKGAEAVDGVRYTKASVMDAYEVLRQLIDDAERYQRFALVAAGGPGLIDGHEDRVIGQYQALQMRIWDDVRSRTRDNPVAPLVRLTP
jgi:hypothetical protein